MQILGIILITYLTASLYRSDSSPTILYRNGIYPITLVHKETFELLNASLFGFNIIIVLRLYFNNSFIFTSLTHDYQSLVISLINLPMQKKILE